MVDLDKCPRWLNTDWVVSQFGKRRAEAQRRYADFVAQGMGQPTPWAAVRGQVVLGSSIFVEKMRPLLGGKDDEREIPRAQRLLHRPELGELLTAATQGDKRARNQAIRQAHLAFGYSMASIARQSGLHYSTVSKILKGER